MIVVGFGKAHHDCSVCANINGVVRYAKLERESQRKHDRAPEWWYWKKLAEWDIPFEKIDCIVETDGGGFTSSGNKLTRMPYDGAAKIIKYNHHYIVDHHLAHAWSITSYNNDCDSVVIDGKGSGDKTTMTRISNTLKRTGQLSPGTAFCELGKILNVGTDKNDMAGKIMGLIPYGKVDNALYQVIKPYRTDLGQILTIFQHRLGDTIPPSEVSCDEPLWKERLSRLSTINEVCYDFVRSYFKTVDKTKPIYYSGGVALNVDWNRRLLDEGFNLVVEPASYDGGLSIGCMRIGCELVGDEQPIIKDFPYIQDDEAPDSEPSQETIKKVAELLAAGKIVGWYQGHGELGPRALGNRSILMDPTVKNGKDILNSKVKHREWFRPFGASVKKDKASKYFDLDENPYMLFTANVIDKNLPAITHVDGTCRHQTVTVESNRLFYSLLDEFETLTGLPVLLNTSLNLGGKPIAGRVQDAIQLFNTTEMDALCVGDTLYIK